MRATLLLALGTSLLLGCSPPPPAATPTPTPATPTAARGGGSGVVDFEPPAPPVGAHQVTHKLEDKLKHQQQQMPTP